MVFQGLCCMSESCAMEVICVANSVERVDCTQFDKTSHWASRCADIFAYDDA